MHKIKHLIMAAWIFLLGLIFVIPNWSCSGEQAGPPSDPLEQMEIAFEENYSKAQIKERIDKAMKLYNVPLTNEYYSRAGSVLVELRKEIGPSEMDILNYMIKSHVPGVAIKFPEAAGLSASFLAAGDK
jgi:hypothetical protein